jgi:hypothetical protein
LGAAADLLLVASAAKEAYSRLPCSSVSDLSPLSSAAETEPEFKGRSGVLEVLEADGESPGKDREKERAKEGSGDASRPDDEDELELWRQLALCINVACKGQILDRGNMGRSVLGMVPTLPALPVGHPVTPEYLLDYLRLVALKEEQLLQCRLQIMQQ